MMVFLPYVPLKALADSLVEDGEFGVLHPENAGVFRVVLASLAVALLACAYLTYFHRWRTLFTFLQHLWVDFLNRLPALIPAKKELPWLVLILILMMVGIINRMEFLFSSLHHDEAYTYMAFAHSLVTAVTDYHLPNNHVFHSILVFLSTRIFGNAPWAVRLPAFAAGVLIIPAMYSLGKRHYNRLIGLCAGLLVAISPALVGYSDNARGYTLVALFGILLLNLGYQVHGSKDRFAWLLLVLVSTLGMYTVPAFLFPFGILFAWLFLEGTTAVRPGYSSKLDFLQYWLISGFCAFVLTLVLYLPILIVSGPDSFLSNQFVAPVAWSGFLETLVQRLKETWVEWTFRVPMWIITLGILGLVLSLALHKKISSIRIPLQLASLVWILMLLIIQRPNAWSKVWVFLLPLVILWSAAGLLGGVGLVGKGRIPVSSSSFHCLPWSGIAPGCLSRNCLDCGTSRMTKKELYSL